MRTRLFTQIPRGTLAVALALTIAQPLVLGSEAQADGGSLVGTWVIQFTRVDCATRAPLAQNAALHTYTPNGTMLSSGTGNGPSPIVDHSDAHGIWEHTGAQTFREHFRFFNYDAAGVHVSTREVTIERVLVQGNNAEADQILGVGTQNLFSPAGVLLSQACREDQGQRMAFEE